MNLPINQAKNDLERIRNQAKARLVELTSLPAEDCTESYLFDQDRFSGVRFILGNAQATWKLGDSDAIYHQNGKAVIQPGSESPTIIQRRAA